MNDQSLESDIEYLTSNGWKEWNKHNFERFDRIWYKKFPDEPRCQLNLDKDKQLAIRLWDNRKYRADAGYGFDVQLRGECKNNNRSMEIIMSVPNNIRDHLDDVCETVFIMWRAVN